MTNEERKIPQIDHLVEEIELINKKLDLIIERLERTTQEVKNIGRIPPGVYFGKYDYNF